ncbi:MAG: hypothetical protein WBO19_12830, partial [Terriglobia bacterium]
PLWSSPVVRYQRSVFPSELRKVPQIVSILGTASSLLMHNVSAGISPQVGHEMPLPGDAKNLTRR